MAQINVSNLTFGYEGSYDTIFKMYRFQSTPAGSLVLWEETERERQRFFSYSWENTNTRERSPARLSSIIFRIR